MHYFCLCDYLEWQLCFVKLSCQKDPLCASYACPAPHQQADSTVPPMLPPMLQMSDALAASVCRGPRSGIIFVNTRRVPNGASRIDSAVFPGLQGGPHENHIAAVAHQLKQARDAGHRLSSSFRKDWCSLVSVINNDLLTYGHFVTSLQLQTHST